MVDSSSSGSLSKKPIDEALKLFESVATTSVMWASEQVVRKKALSVYKVDAYSTLSAQID